jgi:hypothetical protein
LKNQAALALVVLVPGPSWIEPVKTLFVARFGEQWQALETDIPKTPQQKAERNKDVANYLIGGIVALASARCACTCETCGQPARRYRSGGHVVAACTAHMPRGSAEITPPWPLIRIVRDFVDGRSQIVVCQLYDRDLDRFGDASPADLGIDDFR